MLKEAGKSSVEELKVTKSNLKPLVDTYTDALKQLEDVLKVSFKHACKYYICPTHQVKFYISEKHRYYYIYSIFEK